MANKEWSNEYNPFNTWKILFSINELRAIVDGNFMPPVAVDIDPSNACQQHCTYCNSYEYRKRTGFQTMPKGHLLKIADFMKEWGVKSTCIAGGGEPLLNKETRDLIPRLHKHEIEMGVITNGILLDEEYSNLICESARYCGISFDGDDPYIYKMMRGSDSYNEVVRNVKLLNEIRINTQSKLDTNLKFLIHPYNYKSIPGVAKLAKEIGCCGIHIRPVGIDDVPGIANPLKEKSFNMKSCRDEINDLIEEAYTYESSDFKVFAVTHKFGSNFEKVIRFDKCRCTPLAGVFAANGDFMLCFNSRGKPGFTLASHYPDPNEIKKVWSSQYHKDMIDNIDPEKCMRCTFTRYNEVIQHCILEDKMFYKFL